jgi:hypothetical protein
LKKNQEKTKNLRKEKKKENKLNGQMNIKGAPTNEIENM